MESCKKQSFKKQPSKNQLKKSFFVHSIKMVNVSLNESKTIAKIRGVKGYKSIFEETLSILNEPESEKEIENNFDEIIERIERNRKNQKRF